MFAAIKMNKKVKIIVAGIGGVGGYFGGLLANWYANDELIDIYFISRGENLEAIRNNGITIIERDCYTTGIPTLVTDHPADCGIADFLIICTKTYDLSAMLEQLRPVINENTLILPLLNGIDNVEKIQAQLPGTSVLKACVYVVSRLQSPGIIENTGNLQKIFFGSSLINDNRPKQLESILQQAGIDAHYTTAIRKLTWEKFLFISPVATATSYYNSSIGQLAEDPDKMAFVKQLLAEAKMISLAMGIEMDADISEKIITRILSLPYENTSSMHSDYKKGKKETELESLTGYVIRKAVELNLQVTGFEKAYAYLSSRVNY